MDGLEATRQIKRNLDYAEIPIIAMTADAVSGVKKECLDAGMVDFLSKPIIPEDVLLTITKWVNLKSENGINLTTQRNQHSKAKNLVIPQFEHLNTKFGLSICNNNERVYLKVLATFYDSNRNFTQDLLTSYNNADKLTSKRMIHTLKGVAGTIGAEMLMDKANNFLINFEQLSNTDFLIMVDSIKEILDPIIEEIYDKVIIKKQSESIEKDDTISEKDMGNFVSKMKELIKLFEDFDYESVNKLEEIMEIKGAKSNPYIKQITQFSDSYNFDEALNVSKLFLRILLGNENGQ